MKSRVEDDWKRGYLFVRRDHQGSLFLWLVSLAQGERPQQQRAEGLGGSVVEGLSGEGLSDEGVGKLSGWGVEWWGLGGC